MLAARGARVLLGTYPPSPWIDHARDLAAAPGLKPPTFGSDGMLDVPV